MSSRFACFGEAPETSSTRRTAGGVEGTRQAAGPTGDVDRPPWLIIRGPLLLSCAGAGAKERAGELFTCPAGGNGCSVKTGGASAKRQARSSPPAEGAGLAVSRS